MKRKDLLLLMFSLLVVSVTALTGSCASKTKELPQGIEDVNAKEAFDLIGENEGNADFIIIDVRTPEEFDDGHIENAINIDFESDDFKSEINRLDKGKTYLIYCRSGNRSIGALEIMIEMGFMEVYHLTTGILSWLDEGLLIVK